eukprot:777586-Rhodomonas_salina.1
MVLCRGSRPPSEPTGRCNVRLKRRFRVFDCGGWAGRVRVEGEGKESCPRHAVASWVPVQRIVSTA